jgi:hypothetical protein
MITPPFSISARPLLTRMVPSSAIEVILARRAWWNVARRRDAMVVPRQGRREPWYRI